MNTFKEAMKKAIENKGKVYFYRLDESKEAYVYFATTMNKVMINNGVIVSSLTLNQAKKYLEERGEE